LRIDISYDHEGKRIVEKTSKTMAFGALTTGCAMWAPIVPPVGDSGTVAIPAYVALKNLPDKIPAPITVARTANVKTSKRD